MEIETGEREMEEKDIEIWVGENRFYLDKDNILHETLVGELNDKTVIAIREASDKLKDMVEGKVNILVDLNKTGIPTLGARKSGQQAFEKEKIGKVALFGIHPVARVLASFVMGVARKKDMRFFKSKEKALAWLRE